MLQRFRLNSIGLLLLVGLSMSGCSKFAVNNSSLDYRDAQGRIALQQVVRRPHTGVPSAHDGYIDIDRAIQPGPRRQVIAATLQPV